MFLSRVQQKEVWPYRILNFKNIFFNKKIRNWQKKNGFLTVKKF